MTELKQCPFCGGEAVVVEEYLSEEADASADEITYFVSCGLCASRTDNYAIKKRAIEAWNNRPNPWHTGTPTEEGWYLVWMGKINGNINERPAVMLFENGDWASRLVANTYVAWQKIEPYKENEDG